MRTLFICTLLLFSNFMAAQSYDELYEAARKSMRQNRDTSDYLIQQALRLVEKKDTLPWIKTLQLQNDRDFHYRKEEPHQLIPRVDTIITLARAGKHYDIICEVLLDLGYFFRYNSDFNKAEEFYNESLNLANIHNLTVSIAEANNALGVVNYFKGNHIKALEYYRAAMREYVREQDSAKISKSYNNIAIIYKNQRDYLRAIEYYEKAIDTYERWEGRNPNTLRNRYQNLARAYWEVEEYDESERCILRMIELDKEHFTDREDYLISMTLLIDNYSYQNKITEALELSRKIEFKADSLGIPEILPFILMRKAWVFQDAAMYDSALHYYNIIEKPTLRDGDRESLYEFNKGKAEVLIAKNQPSKAVGYAAEALRISRATGVKEWIFHTHEILYQAYKKVGNTSKALYSLEQFKAYSDSLWNEGKSIELGLKQNEIELVQAEAKNSLLETASQLQVQTIKTQRSTIIGAIVAVGLLLTIAVLFWRQGKVRKSLLEKIETQSKKLQELDAAKTRFFANVSHDLRSPLTLILGALDNIAAREFEILDQESKELLDVGYKNGKRLLYLADEIMDLTRLEEGKIQLDLQYVKIVPYLRLLTKMFSSAADIKSIDMKFMVEVDEEAIIQLDPHQFEKIIYNLISNAIKFTPNDGEVNIRLGTRKKDLEIVISDSGSGISLDSLDYIFDRYYQAGSSEFKAQTGVGIGLALVKELVELHRGNIQVSSSKRGTTFQLLIPYKESNWVSQAIVPERSLDVITRNSLWIDLQEEKQKLQVPSLENNKEDAPPILIVEDHKELRSYLKSILSHEFRVYLAADGNRALEVLQSEEISLIITDLMMPYMDGFELIDHLKKDKELRKIPVLVVSARTEKAEKLNLIANGAVDVISKPFDKEELFVRIKRILHSEWDSKQKLSILYGESVGEFEKNIMLRLEKLILRRIDDPHLSVLDLADEMAASERKVYRLIKKISGLTPYELIKEVRWQYLENHLKKNNVRTATEAARLIGMNNVSSFSEQYSKRFGRSVKEMIN